MTNDISRNTRCYANDFVGIASNTINVQFEELKEIIIKYFIELFDMKQNVHFLINL